MSVSSKLVLIINILKLVIKYLPYVIELIKDINNVPDDQLQEAERVCNLIS